MSVRTTSRQRLLSAFDASDAGMCMHDAAQQAGMPADKARQAVIDFKRSGLIAPAGMAHVPHCRKPVQLYKRCQETQGNDASGFNAREVLNDQSAWRDLADIWTRGA